jgi:quercetin dioxygenase-like cupin family protein
MYKHDNKFHSPFVSGLLGLLLIAGANSTVMAESTSARAVKSSQIEFQQIAPFVKMGAAWGDRATSNHGTFGEFPGGAASPMHTHSGAYHGIVISGTMTNPFGNEKNPPQMGPGSYWFVPANAEHVTACISKEPCLFYFHADGAFDFTPTE